MHLRPIHYFPNFISFFQDFKKITKFQDFSRFTVIFQKAFQVERGLGTLLGPRTWCAILWIQKLFIFHGVVVWQQLPFHKMRLQCYSRILRLMEPLLVTRNNQSNITAYLQGRQSNKNKFESSNKIFHQLFWATCRKIKQCRSIYFRIRLSSSWIQISLDEMS